MVSDAKRKANKKWNDRNSKTYAIRVMRKNDSEIIEFLDSIENRSEYIKQLIRNDIKNRKTDKQE
jgi:hypothetical protein